MDPQPIIENKAAIVFSVGLDARNYLRNLVSRFGFSVVCFENECICYDNLKSIQPDIVVVETDYPEVVWRFIFALHAIEAVIPLVVVSDRLKKDSFCNNGIQIPIKVIAMNQLERRLLDEYRKNSDRQKGEVRASTNKHLPLFVGNFQVIKQIQSILPSIAETRDPVMITGEQGTGKELLARLIVERSKNEQDFIKIDCRQLVPDMLSDATFSEKFGMGKNGRQATIFLDHLDQLPILSQAEMLLLMEASKNNQNGYGTGKGRPIRIIAAADTTIGGIVQKGGFRKDLFYRLNVIPVALPALRKRKEDISLLMDYFTIAEYAKKQKCIRIPSQQAREICFMHNWPGNVKELQEQMARIVETGSETHLKANPVMPQKAQINSREYLFNRLAAQELPKSYEIQDYLPALKNMSLKGICGEFVARTERRLMKRALISTSWNRKKAAELLNISYKSMLNKIKVYDII